MSLLQSHSLVWELFSLEIAGIYFQSGPKNAAIHNLCLQSTAFKMHTSLISGSVTFQARTRTWIRTKAFFSFSPKTKVNRLQWSLVPVLQPAQEKGKLTLPEPRVTTIKNYLSGSGSSHFKCREQPPGWDSIFSQDVESLNAQSCRKPALCWKERWQWSLLYMQHFGFLQNLKKILWCSLTKKAKQKSNNNNQNPH